MTWNRVTRLAAAAAGACMGLMGQCSALMSALACFMAVDYLTGLVVAWRGRSPKTAHGGISSKAGFDGLIRKAFIIAVILMATQLDRAVGNEGAMFQTAAATYYLANEGISILENTSLMGVPYPAAIRRALEALREDARDDDAH